MIAAIHWYGSSTELPAYWREDMIQRKLGENREKRQRPRSSEKLRSLQLSILLIYCIDKLRYPYAISLIARKKSARLCAHVARQGFSQLGAFINGVSGDISVSSIYIYSKVYTTPYHHAVTSSSVQYGFTTHFRELCS